MTIRPSDHNIEDGACRRIVANYQPHSVDDLHWVRFNVRPSLDLAFRALQTKAEDGEAAGRLHLRSIAGFGLHRRQRVANGDGDGMSAFFVLGQIG